MSAAIRGLTTTVLRALCRALARSGRTVIIDTETTDFAGQICELAVIEARSGNLLLSTLVRPDVPIAEDAQRVHGITPQMCETAPAMAELVPALRSVLRGRVVLAWNAPFDRGVVAAEFHRARLRPPRCWWVCLMRLEARVNGRPWRSLAGGHRALSDVVAAREALLALT